MGLWPDQRPVSELLRQRCFHFPAAEQPCFTGYLHWVQENFFKQDQSGILAQNFSVCGNLLGDFFFPVRFRTRLKHSVKCSSYNCRVSGAADLCKPSWATTWGGLSFGLRSGHAPPRSSGSLARGGNHSHRERQQWLAQDPQ